MNAVVIKVDAAALRDRRQRALDSVHLDEAVLRARVEAGIASPDEVDAWEEVDVVAFLLSGLVRASS
jgi:hypothetical protein